jgi:hypothetical protein
MCEKRDAIAVSNASLTDRFAAFEVHVYRLKSAGQ